MNTALNKFLAPLIRILEGLVILTMTLLVLDVLWGVLTRFVLNSPSRWTEELATFLLMWLSMLGAAVATARQEHLGVDFLVDAFEPSARRLSAIVVQLLVLVFVCFALVYGGYVLVSETLRAGQVTPALGIRMGYVYIAVPVSGIFMALFSLARLQDLLSGPAPVEAEGNSSKSTG